VHPNGAQNYPFCFNLAISGNGTDKPAGVLATTFYTAKNSGIMYHFDGPPPLPAYTIPSPALYSGAITTVSQVKVPKATAPGVGMTALAGMRIR
jgi:cellulase